MVLALVLGLQFVELLGASSASRSRRSSASIPLTRSTTGPAIAGISSPCSRNSGCSPISGPMIAPTCASLSCFTALRRALTSTASSMRPRSSSSMVGLCAGVPKTASGRLRRRGGRRPVRAPPVPSPRRARPGPSSSRGRATTPGGPRAPRAGSPSRPAPLAVAGVLDDPVDDERRHRDLELPQPGDQLALRGRPSSRGSRRRGTRSAGGPAGLADRAPAGRASRRTSRRRRRRAPSGPQHRPRGVDLPADLFAEVGRRRQPALHHRGEVEQAERAPSARCRTPRGPSGRRRRGWRERPAPPARRCRAGRTRRTAPPPRRRRGGCPPTRTRRPAPRTARGTARCRPRGRLRRPTARR